MNVRHFGDSSQIPRHCSAVSPLQAHLKVRAAVEVVLDGPFLAPGDDEDIGDAAGHGLFHDVLDGRRVDDRQHLLGLRLGGGQESGPAPGGGNDGFRDGGH